MNHHDPTEKPTYRPSVPAIVAACAVWMALGILYVITR